MRRRVCLGFNGSMSGVGARSRRHRVAGSQPTGRVARPASPQLDDRESALAEYTALRQEIADRKATENTVVTLQITVSGALFSFALSTSPGRAGFLLIVPVTTYMLFMRFAQQYYGVRNASKYTTEQLSHRVNGGFGWDEWRRANGAYASSVSTKLIALLLAASTAVITFPAVAGVALVWAIPYSFFPAVPRSPVESVTFAAAWLIGCVATLLSAVVGMRLRRAWGEV